MIGWLVKLAEKGYLPDVLVRMGIRMLNRMRLKQESAGGPDKQSQRKNDLINNLRDGPIALFTEDANQQHYEVPTALFHHVLGPRMKYSCCYWPKGVFDLAAAEEAALSQICERAGIVDGQQILDLGCGWGSLSMWIAEHYPSCRVTAVSNSRTQIQHIQSSCHIRGLTNINAMVCNINDFDPTEQFDRVCSIEMFEHMNNYHLLLQRIEGWLKPSGKLFVHVFAHRTMPYRFEIRGAADWMGRYFFTGGLMPSDDLLLHFQDDLVIEKHWTLNGQHYEKTGEAWLKNLDQSRDKVLPILQQVSGKESKKWFRRWRLFFLACIELWKFKSGNEWVISHYRFRKRNP